MDRASRLLLAHEYERLALIWRLAEMLVGDSTQERVARIRAQAGPVPGWDDIVEYGGAQAGALRRWQVKNQLTPMPCAHFDQLLRVLTDRSFRAVLLCSAPFEITGVGSLRSLKELLRRAHLPGVESGELDGDLSADETRWQRHLRALDLRDLPGRLEVRFAGDAEGLTDHAEKALRVLFADPEDALDALVRYVGDKRDPVKDFTAEELLTGPLRSFNRARRPWHGHAFDLARVREHVHARVATATPRVPTLVRADDDLVDLAELVQRVRVAPVTSLIGPGGSGKSLLLHHLAGLLLQAGVLPLLVRAGRGDSGVLAWLDEGARVLGTPGIEPLLAAAAAAGLPATVMLDGLDLPDAAQIAHDAQGLVRGLGASLLVASHRRLLREGLLIEVPPLTAKERRALWQLRTGREPVEEERSVLDALSAPLDIVHASEAGIRLEDPTRYQLIAAVVAARGVSRDHRAQLQRCAAYLADRLAVIARAGELRRRGLLPEAAGLLLVEDGWATFAHDEIRAFFLAEHLLTEHLDPSELARAASHPRHGGVLEHLLGADQDDRTLEALLDRVGDPDLARRILGGELGLRVGNLARLRQSRLFDDARDEVEQLGRHLVAGGALGTFPAPPPFAATLLSLRVQGGWDKALADEVIRLVRRLDEVALDVCDSRAREDRFRLLYHRWSPSCLAAMLAQAARSAGGHPHQPLADARQQEQLTKPPWSPGTLYLVLPWIQRGEPPESTVALIDAAWRTELHPLQFEALMAIPRVIDALSEDSAALLRGLARRMRPRNGVLDQTWAETMVAIGEEEQGQAIAFEFALGELRGLAQEPGGPDAAERAAWYWNLQFEDFGSDCYAAFEALEPEELVTVLNLAGMALSADHAFLFEPMLLGRLLELGDPRSVAVFRRWAASPPPRSFSSGCAEACWVLAHAGLQAHGLPPPPPVQDGDAGAAWYALATSLYGAPAVGANEGARVGQLWETWTRMAPCAVLETAFRFDRGRDYAECRRLTLPAIDLWTGQDTRVRAVLCRALDGGALNDDSHLETRGELLNLIERLTDRDIADRLVRHVDDTATGARLATVVRRVRTPRRHV